MPLILNDSRTVLKHKFRSWSQTGPFICEENLLQVSLQKLRAVIPACCKASCGFLHRCVQHYSAWRLEEKYCPSPRSTWEAAMWASLWHCSDWPPRVFWRLLFTCFWRFLNQIIARLYLFSLTCQRQVWVLHFRSDGSVIASLAREKKRKKN